MWKPGMVHTPVTAMQELGRRNSWMPELTGWWSHELKKKKKWCGQHSSTLEHMYAYMNTTDTHIHTWNLLCWCCLISSMDLQNMFQPGVPVQTKPSFKLSLLTVIAIIKSYPPIYTYITYNTYICLDIHMYICIVFCLLVCLCATCMLRPWRPGEGIRSFGTDRS